MTEYKKASTPVLLDASQRHWALHILLPMHAERLGVHELKRLDKDFSGASPAVNGCSWWDRGRREFLHAGPFVGRTFDLSYYFFVDEEVLRVVDTGGWLGPCRLSFQKYPRELEARRAEFQERLASILRRSGLAWPLNDEPWPVLAPDAQAACQPQFIPDDQSTPDTL